MAAPLPLQQKEAPSTTQCWPPSFASQAASQAISYNSCNEFFNVDVTEYLSYTAFSGCTADEIDPETCPTLAIIATNNEFPGGTPAFQTQVSLWMDLTCNCVPTEVETVSISRAMTCEDVGDCPVNFIFPSTIDEQQDIDTPFNASTCTIVEATLELESRGYRTKPPTIAFSSGDLGAADLSSFAENACGATVDPDAPSCSSPAVTSDQCFESDTAPNGELDVLPYVDSPANWKNGVIAAVTLHQGIFVDENCPESEVDATFTWKYQCPSGGDDDAVEAEGETEQVTYHLRGADAMRHLSIA
jgi:hypothetical protein